LKRILFLLLGMLVIPVSVFAENPLLDPPHWSFEAKGGVYAPSLPGWSQYYGKRDMPEFAASLAYKLIRQLDIGVEAGRTAARGKAFAPLHNITTGDVDLELYPVNVFVLFRGVMDEEQWLIPYLGGGWSKVLYTERIEGQDSVKGSAEGYHVRGGIQLLLDGADRGAANNLYKEYGIYHTYFFIEAEKVRAIVKSASVNLGGVGYRAGLLFEF
jgi:hypothetical protein